jgi:hypothetical protein
MIGNELVAAASFVSDGMKNGKQLRRKRNEKISKPTKRTNCADGPGKEVNISKNGER